MPPPTLDFGNGLPVRIHDSNSYIYIYIYIFVCTKFDCTLLISFSFQLAAVSKELRQRYSDDLVAQLCREKADIRWVGCT